MHGLRIGVHGEEGRAQPGDALDALRDGVADVMQLHVEKNALAGAGKRLGHGEPAGESELIADLVEHDRIAESADHRLRLGDRRQIERNDQSLARLEHRHHPFASPSMRAYSISLRTTSLSWLAARASLS